VKSEYGLQIPPSIDRRLRQLRGHVQNTIRIRLKEVTDAASSIPRGALVPPLGPALRFYVEGYRVFYEVDVVGRRVVVLELRRAFA
jgi:mRNA-degrading endonuclease RelE of RelBE toxin-antitoxin system